jgi:hypothetical protein
MNPLLRVGARGERRGDAAPARRGGHVACGTPGLIRSARVERSTRACTRLHEPAAPLTATCKAGGYLDDSALRRRYKVAQAKAGLRPLRFHDLRHTFGTHAIRAVDPRELQEWMGHADFSTTEIYLSYRPSTDAAQRLGRVLGENAAHGPTGFDHPRLTTGNDGR